MTEPRPLNVLLRKLIAFAEEKPFEERRQAAAQRFFSTPQARAQAEAYVAPFLDYFIFTFADETGARLVDRFVADRSGELTQEERPLAAELKQAIYGLYEVAECDPGTGMVLERVGIGSHHSVVEAEASRHLVAGQCIFARLTRIEKHWEIVSEPMAMPPEASDDLKTMYEQFGEDAVGELSDPAKVHRLIWTLGGG